MVLPIILIVVSVLLQFVAAWLALRNVHLTERRSTWIILGIAVALMGVRRMITLVDWLDTGPVAHHNISAEIVGVAISILMVIGIAMLRPILRSMKSLNTDLSESRELYRDLFETAQVGIYRTTPDGQILAANPKLVEMLGYHTVEELSRINVEDEGYGANYSRAHFKEMVEREGTVRGLESGWLRRDGSMLYVQENATAIRSVDGNVKYYAGTIEDVTDRIEAETALKHSREHMAVTLRSIAEGVITTDIDQLVLSMNPTAERLTGWKEAEAVGRHLVDVFRLEDGDDPLAGLRRHRKDRKTPLPFRAEGVLIASDQAKRTVTRIASILKGDDNELVGTVLVFNDVTEQRRLEAEAMRTQRVESIALLAGGIAHDFNNVLTSALGHTGMAIEEARAKGAISGHLVDAEAALMRARGLTRQLQTFARGGEPEKRPTSMEDVINESIFFILRGSNVRCDVEIEPGIRAVNVDPVQLGQVIQNLVMNADQAMPDGGVMTLAVKNKDICEPNRYGLPEGQYVSAVVTDTGMGIASDDIGRIFDPYFTTKSSGKGLGLAVSFSIVKNHDGALVVDSKVGEGTLFEILLPAEEQEPERPVVFSGRVDGAGRRILVMDDDPDVQKILKSMITALGFDVEVVPEGTTAIRRFREAQEGGSPFVAVFLDLTVPGGMGGQATLKTLRRLDPDVRAIVASGYSEDLIVAEAKKHGFHSSVTKPFRLEELARVLSEVIREDGG